MKHHKKVSVQMRSELQTPESVRDLIHGMFPWISECYTQGLPFLGYDNKDPKKRYQLVWVMPVYEIASNGGEEGAKSFFLYYPKKEKVVQAFNSHVTPLQDEDKLPVSGKETMRVVNFEGRISLQIDVVRRVII